MDQDFTITQNDLLNRLGTARAPLLIDVCIPADIAADPWRLPGAFHVPHTDIANWAEAQPTQDPIVVICQKGLKLSHGATARLRARGFAAKALHGGNMSWFATGLPRVSWDAPRPGTPWVLPMGDIPQCLVFAWTIRRWFDAKAELLWVAEDMIADVADKFSAQPVLRASTPSNLCHASGLDYAPLTSFLVQFETDKTSQLPLLGALPALHPTPEERVEAALTILDAAWIAHRGVLK